MSAVVSKLISSPSDIQLLVAGESSGMDRTKVKLLSSSFSMDESFSSAFSVSVQLYIFF